MTDIDTLIEENRTNHYKLLTVVGNNKSKIEKIAKYLEGKGWKIYDVEENVLELTEGMSQDKIRLRIGEKLKKWINDAENKVVLVNTNILYSEEMDKIGPFSAFKYNMRGDKEGVLFMDARLKGNVAIYSTPDRPDYHKRELSDVLFVELDDVEVPERV